MRVSIKCGPPPTEATEASEATDATSEILARLRFIFRLHLAERKKTRKYPQLFALKPCSAVDHYNSIMAVKQFYFTLFMLDASHQVKTTAKVLL